ncbi:MAG: cell wall-binding repeat-containing protein [Clostridium tyrobutyricum]|jgi:putative cell wall-binding protein|uniref:cell wall-binding repeat-containing protein n=1 Tax=Clostridium tyrobutyricum TaxID=1519 RepID=UPI00243167AF|nr:cell wall-binding repeat-containing protein [Clostridium tyrobutyricum]MCH4198406.1 cell wall-binding repeat-containing protein [Clostridium tyrobutyricum]MCH4257569.1 cell wall-binding repeat-containing protein [Clostridium tyrobutyricum]MCI1238161.1 cell wall-binding repeat-containing protein [Clostridium tyrobutyricum]MCI1651874.1 cell wall-binding repeat-containing protein [Clostridium tyrobutyricum]MCI1936671.1 cell wall-binding repeat-containing protein [Clostridium tyrobutyricum]
MNQHLKKLVSKTASFMLCFLVVSSGLIVPISAKAAENTETSQSVTSQEINPDIKDITFAPGADQSQINFAWYSKSTSDPQVQIVLKPDMTGSTFPEDKAKTFKGQKSEGNDGYTSNKVTVTGLKQATAYVYRVGDGTNWSSVDNYTTQDISKGINFLFAGDPQIGASGDIAKDGDGWVDTLNKALDKFKNTDFIMSIGDQVNNGKESQDESGAVKNEGEYDQFFKPSQIKNTPLVTIAGNHEGYGPGHSTHFNYTNMSDKYGIFNNNGFESDKSNGTTGNDYYYVYGNTLFMMLNSNDINAEDHKAFMQQAIAANPNVKWKIVGMHHSIYSSANHEKDDDIAQRRLTHPEVFESLGIDVVLDGHDHCYTRSNQMLGGKAVSVEDSKDGKVTNPQGILYVTANSASGSKYYEIKEPDQKNYYEAVKWQDHVPTFSNVSIDDNNFKITTYRTDNMEVVDTYTITKTESPKQVRLGGQNRYETSAKISQNKWTSADSAVVVSGEAFADALSAAPFAKQINAPILLTSSNSLDNNTSSELSRLKVKNVYIIGGTGVVSSSVENAVKKMKINVQRISGSDRYATSLEVAKKISKPEQIFIASGQGFADGLSISSYAASSGSPVLLINGNKLTNATLQYVKDNSSKMYVVGGTGVVSDSIVKSLGAERISGADRYATNLAVLNKFNDKYDLSNIYLASGNGFADALCGSSAAGKESAPIILLNRDGNSNDLKNYIKSGLVNANQIYVLGGEGVVSQNTVDKLLQ